MSPPNPPRHQHLHQPPPAFFALSYGKTPESVIFSQCLSFLFSSLIRFSSSTVSKLFFVKSPVGSMLPVAMVNSYSFYWTTYQWLLTAAHSLFLKLFLHLALQHLVSLLPQWFSFFFPASSFLDF